MKRKTITTLLLLSVAAIFVLVIVGTLCQLPNWFGIVMLALMCLWLWAAYCHWPAVFRMLYGGGSLQDAERESRDEE